MAKSSLLDPKVRAAKKRKQAIVLGVVFVAVLAISVPQTMKMMNQSAPTSTGSSEPAGATGATAATAVAAAGTAQAIAATSGEPQVVAADLAPAPLDGQLVEFDAFEAKDPFVQQQVATAGFENAGSTGAANSTAAAEKNGSRGVVDNEKPDQNAENTSPAVPDVPTSAPSATPATGTTGTTTTPPAQFSSATISVNGVQESVNVASDFPAASPLFRLRKVTAKTADISVAGGTLASGAPTVTLKLGKPLTLMNTADGTRYVLILVATGSAPATGSTTPTAP